MKRFNFKVLVYFAVSNLLFTTCSANDSGKVYFEKSGGVVLNPGQGWVLYGHPSNHSDATIVLGTTGYTRYDWSEINPSEGVYNWAPIDHYIAQWAQRGKQFAFGIMSVNVHGNVYGTPKWVFDKGAKYTMGKGYNIPESNPNAVFYVPVWNDPIYVAECKRFVEVLAERYDGDPNIAFIDIRNFGSWGEIHMYPLYNNHGSVEHWISVEDVQELLFKPYIDNFKKTQIIMSWSPSYLPLGDGINNWAVEKGLGLRSDGIIGDDNDPYGKALVRAARKTPIVWEFREPFRNFEAQQSWNDNRFINAVRENMPNYIGMGHSGDDAQYMLSKKSKLIREIANLMGYNLSMTAASYYDMISVGETIEISLSIENSGVTNMLTDCVMKLALLDSNNMVVSSFTTDWNAKSINGGEAATFKTNAVFADAPAGNYKLAIGLYRNENSQKPTYNMDNKLRTHDGFYVIGILNIEN